MGTKKSTLSSKAKRAYPDISEINAVTAYKAIQLHPDYLDKMELLREAREHNIKLHIPTLLKFKPDLNVDSFIELLTAFFDYIEFKLIEIDSLIPDAHIHGLVIDQCFDNY